MKIRQLIFIFLIWLFHGCASLSTPGGGPKDKQPPVLIHSIPNNNQTNFKEKTIELTFDEMVKLNNAKDEIIISPSPGKNIDIKVKAGTKVTLFSPNGWKDSTTYSILFREGIQDVTESNVPTNLKLAFSTGTHIDSLKIKGNVTELLKGTAAEKITVGIYAADTFDIFTDIPAYFTKTDKKGNFTLENIKPGTYKIYAFDDKNKNLIVESRTERYAFKTRPLFLVNNIDSLKLGLIMLDSRPLKMTAIRNIGTMTRLRFNKLISDYTIHPDSNLTHSFGDNQTEVMIWNPPAVSDSLQITFTASDSLDNKLDSVFYIKKTDTSPLPESFKWSLGSPTIIAETGKFQTLIKSNKPPIRINTDSLFIEVDTVSRITISKEDLNFNLNHKQITITKNLDKAIFKTEKDLKLILKTGKGFLYSPDNDTSKTLTKPIDIIWPEETGLIITEVSSKEKSYILQLLDKDGNIVSSAENAVKHTFRNLLPMEYQIRIIIDDNKNGKWDPGNIQNGVEPESVYYYINSAGKKSFPVRANWELGPLIITF